MVIWGNFGGRAEEDVNVRKWGCGGGRGGLTKVGDVVLGADVGQRPTGKQLR